MFRSKTGTERVEPDLSAEVQHDGDDTEIRLRGIINELSDDALRGAFADARSTVRINLRDVRRINSRGLAILVRLLDELHEQYRIEYAECSEVIVDQFQMLEFSRYGRMVSFFIRYRCERCGNEESRLVDVARDVSVTPNLDRVAAPAQECSGCCGTLVVDDSLDFVLDHLR